MNVRTFEGEFLTLAAIYLACRWKVMGQDLTPAQEWPKPDLANDLLGMVDYSAEMRLLVEARRLELQGAL